MSYRTQADTHASVLLRAGAKSCEMYFVKTGGGVLFIHGTNDEGDVVEVAISQTESVEMTAKSGEVVERQVPLPLFDAAKEPPKDEEPSHGDEDDES